MQDCIVFYLAHHADFVDHAHPVFSLYTHDVKNFIVQSPCNIPLFVALNDFEL
jgi:hypothetical protein